MIVNTSIQAAQVALLALTEEIQTLHQTVDSLQSQLDAANAQGKAMALEQLAFTQAKAAAAALPQTPGPHSYTAHHPFNVYLLYAGTSCEGPILKVGDKVTLTANFNPLENRTWLINATLPPTLVS